MIVFKVCSGGIGECVVFLVCLVGDGVGYGSGCFYLGEVVGVCIF